MTWFVLEPCKTAGAARILSEHPKREDAEREAARFQRNGHPEAFAVELEAADIEGRIIG